MLTRFRASVITLALLLGVTASAGAEPGTSLTAIVGANNLVTLNWTAVPGATYVITATYNGVPIQYPLGTLTSLTLTVPDGNYTATITPFVGGVPGVASNPVVFSAPRATPTPSSLGAIVNGNNLLVSWKLDDPSEVSSVWLGVGTQPGVYNIGVFPLGPIEHFPVSGVPAGTYYLQALSIGRRGPSAPSSAIGIAVPGCEASGPIPLDLINYFGYVDISWPAIPGALGYQVKVSATPGGAALFSGVFGPTKTEVSFPGVPEGNYYVTVQAQLSCGQIATSGEEMLVVDHSAGNGPRTADPAPGQRLPLPEGYARQIINDMGARYPFELQNSCRDYGGNNTWLFRVVQALRQRDSRWGLNWKRGVVGDMSQDVITYHFGPGADEGSTDVYIIDIINSHCPAPGYANPSPGWGDKTESTRAGGTIGRFTLLPFIQAGFKP